MGNLFLCANLPHSHGKTVNVWWDPLPFVFKRWGEKSTTRLNKSHIIIVNRFFHFG